MSIISGNGSRDLRPLALISLAIAIVIATFIAAQAWRSVKMAPPSRTIEVTGSAKRRIVSDLIEWTATIDTNEKDRTAASKALHEHVDKTLAYLKGQGVKDQEIRVSSVTAEEKIETEFIGSGDERVERPVHKGWTTSQEIKVQSTDVPRVERVSREVTQLLEQGVPIQSSAPAYYYTKLGELKIQMLAEASKDARTRAESMVKAAGGGDLGKLRKADMGVININSPNSTSTSWEGNNDTESLEKDIITIVHTSFELR